tara:strand:+ start:3534 stop:4118 length:585 start_codon:yes stop_codon:yes gene_type:complete
MKRTTLLALGLIASTVTAGGAIAQATPQHGDGGGQAENAPHQGGLGGAGMAGGIGSNMGRMMQMMHGEMMSGVMMGGAADMAFDTDGDGKVSPDEMSIGLAAQLAQYDADGDGVLSIAEFEALYSVKTRNQMVDRFQALDEDGDGQITSEEMAAPAARAAKMAMIYAQTADADTDHMSPGEGTDDDGMMNNDYN